MIVCCLAPEPFLAGGSGSPADAPGPVHHGEPIAIDAGAEGDTCPGLPLGLAEAGSSDVMSEENS